MLEDKILVVDDDPGFCSMLTRFLSDEGYTAEYALGGEEGLVKLKRDFYDIVILDIKMPKIDGLEVLKQLKTFQNPEQESIVIVITGYISSNTPVTALKLGATDYIIKPFELDEFLRSVERNIKIVRLRKERNVYYKELSRTNEELLKTIKELDETKNRLVISEKLAAVGQLASMVGHEIRNPLEIIENNAYLLQKAFNPSDEKIKKHFSSMLRGIDDAVEIVEELLNFSKDKQLSIAEVSLEKVIGETLEGVNAGAKIKIEKQLDQSADNIQADPHRLRQVLTNLISNAIQSIHSKDGKIVIKTISEHENVRISISDNGSGMNEEKLKNLFNPFFTTKEKGLGLGLVVVKEIIEKHHGSIKVNSRENEGTTFHITIPKTQPQIKTQN
jgi:signal transduction histidine kinase